MDKRENDKLVNLGTNDVNIRAGEGFSWVANIVGILSWIGIGGSSVWAVLSANLWILFVTLGLAILVFILHVVQNKARSITSRIMRLFAPDMPYSYENWEIEYEYISEDNLRYQAIYDVKAQQVGVDYIVVRYYWTGEDEDNVIVPEVIQDEGFETSRIEYIGVEYGYKYYAVYSRRKHNTGETFRLGVRINNMKVGKRTPVPHLVTTISAPTKCLIMRIIFPNCISPHDALEKEYVHSSDYYHWKSKKLKTEHTGFKSLLESRIGDPIYGGKYCIEWVPQYVEGGLPQIIEGEVEEISN